MGDNVKRGNFKQAADSLLLAAPICKNDTPYNDHHISAVNDKVSGKKKYSGYKGLKRVDKGSSGVELMYYSLKQYKKMPEDQTEELRIWRIKRSNKNADQGDGGGPSEKQNNDSQISALETHNKELNDKTNQLLATVSAQGQPSQEPHNTTVYNKENPNLVRIHRPPTQNHS